MGKVVGFELNSQQPEKAIDFYSEVFGWKVAPPNWEYWPVTTADNTGAINGGISKGPSDYPHGIRIQIEVESIDETISKATGKGALVVREKMEFDDFFLAYLVDPTGLGIGLIETKNK
ncbi:putative enzyme related to lactoylglutathione lyase [Sporosarcina luteola]|nr:putative enzyme related to lactoylglutathione lyase [Sporosarcina luteola]